MQHGLFYDFLFFLLPFGLDGVINAEEHLKNEKEKNPPCPCPLITLLIWFLTISTVTSQIAQLERSNKVVVERLRRAEEDDYDDVPMKEPPEKLQVPARLEKSSTPVSNPEENVMTETRDDLLQVI